MGCECNKKSKIVFGVGFCLFLVGVIVFISAIVMADASVQVGFEAEGVTSPTLQTADPQGGLGYSLHIRASEHANCASLYSGITIKDPNDNDVTWSWNSCSSSQQGWETENDPELRQIATFTLTSSSGTNLHGDYKITSSTELWIVDKGEELGEAVGGIFAAMGIILVAVVFLVAGSIVCCVGCCCLGPENQSPTVVQVGAQVAGSPVAIVPGQPVKVVAA